MFVHLKRSFISRHESSYNTKPYIGPIHIKKKDYFCHLWVSDPLVKGFEPDWSPDGSRLAFSLGALGNSGVAVYNFTSQEAELLITPGRSPSWSPDGKYIAYVRNCQSLRFSALLKAPIPDAFAWIRFPPGVRRIQMSSITIHVRISCSMPSPSMKRRRDLGPCLPVPTGIHTSPVTGVSPFRSRRTIGMWPSSGSIHWRSWSWRITPESANGQASLNPWKATGPPTGVSSVWDAIIQAFGSSIWIRSRLAPLRSPAFFNGCKHAPAGCLSMVFGK